MVYYNHKNTGRPLTGKWFSKFQSNYLDVDNDPLYPFAHGLSYTEFETYGLTLDKQHIHQNEKIHVHLHVKNIGSSTGEEVVLLYLQDHVASVLSELFALVFPWVLPH